MTKFELARASYRSDLARAHNWELLERLGVRLVRGDIRDREQLLDHISGCDYIVHTAAQPAITISVEDPLHDLSTNVMGTVNVLESARRHAVPLVSCATIHVYGNWINQELRETQTRFVRDPPGVPEGAPTMQGHLTPLHASKASAEHYVRVYANTYGVRAGSFRLTGLYGTRQFGGEDHGWVAHFAIQNITRRPITIFGTGKQVRDILYAQDVAEAFMAFFERGEPGVYNIGGGVQRSISLLECIELLERTTGLASDTRFEAPRLGDLEYFVCDIRKAKEVLRWTPSVTPEKGIPQLVDWIQTHREIFAPAGTK